MQLSISARHGHLSPVTQERIAEKVEKVRKYYDRVNAIQVTVDLEHRETPSLELRVSAERAEDFVATAQAEDMIAALDQAIHKIEQQLRKHKERKQESHRSPARKHLEPPAP